MDDLLAALGLLLVIEGALCALAPAALRRILLQTLETPERVLRAGGLAAAALGVLVVALARG